MTTIDHQISQLLASNQNAAKVLVPKDRLADVAMTHSVPVEGHSHEFTEVQNATGDAIARQFPPPPGEVNTKQDDFNAAIAAGYTVTPEGFILALGPEDRAQFAQLLALVREALDLGLITGTTPQSIKAKDGTLHTVTTDRLRSLLVGYGFHFKTLWDNLNS